MKITFTLSEIDKWLEALNNHFCTDSLEAIEQYDMIVKKFNNSIIRSEASIGKIRAIDDAKRKKQLEHDNTVRETVLKTYRKMRTESD